MQHQSPAVAPRLLITGGAGFLGTNLAAAAVASCEVVLLDNLARNSLPNVPAAQRERYRLIEGDVTNPQDLAEAARDAHFVVHLAAIAGVHNYYERPFDVLRVNAGGTLALLQALTPQPPQRLVFVSTSEVYGRHAADAKEDDLLQVDHYAEMRWTYAVSKIAAEKACLAWGKQFGTEVVCLRPFNIYGPGQTGAGAVRDMILAGLAGRDLILHGDGSQVRAWCYVDDFTSAVMAALHAPDIEGEVFNIGNPDAAVTVAELAKQIVAATGNRSRIRREAHFGTDIPYRTPNVDKARARLGVAPATPLSEGLQQTVAWYRDHE
ncbi:MAG: NAD-dependent epimerase/dehydratase family protein [Candidatus Lernaella stagnicola]|nr:NAD-dependent epimerase/dehydratase family protein [Candidatus Lernaella stagnicola]